MRRSSPIGSPRKLEDIPAVEITEVAVAIKEPVLLLPPPTKVAHAPNIFKGDPDYLEDDDYWVDRSNYGHETALQLWYHRVRCG